MHVGRWVSAEIRVKSKDEGSDEAGEKFKQCVYPRIRSEVKVKVAQSCLTLCDPMDCSPPGSSVHGILQARTLEWVAMPSSRGSSQPRD